MRVRKGGRIAIIEAAPRAKVGALQVNTNSPFFGPEGGEVLRQGVGDVPCPTRTLVATFGACALRLSRRSLAFLVCSRASASSIHLQYPSHYTLLSATIPLDYTYTFL